MSNLLRCLVSPHLFLIAATFFFFALDVAAAPVLNATSIAQHLGDPSLGLSNGTKVFLKTTPGFANETARYTSHDAPDYIAAVQPALESDVQKIVKFATGLGIPFLATGGGHGFATTFARLRNGIEINLGGFKQVSVDSSAKTMTIGGSVIFEEVIDPLYNAGFELPIGSQACVGMVGATLGGGVGRYNGLHGMLADTLRSVRIVTASGDCVTASATENSDLFWGLRGAGFNFGIVVSATYDVYELTNQGQVMNADFLYLANQSAPVLQYFQSQTAAPAELSLILQSGFNAALGGAYYVVNALYAGSLDEGTALVQGLVKAGPVKQAISMIQWNEINAKSFFGSAPALCSKGTNQNVYGLGIQTYDVPTLQTFLLGLQKLFRDQPATQQSVFFIEAFPNQAVKAVSADATAYAWRDITAHLLFNYAYNDSSLESTVNAFATQARAELSAKSGFSEEQVYVLYGHGDESPEILYSAEKLPRLRELKKKWDPTGQFVFNVPF